MVAVNAIEMAVGALRHSAATLCFRCQTPTYADAAWNTDRSEPVCSNCADALCIIRTVREPAEYPYDLRLSWPPIITPWKPIEECGDRRLVSVEPAPPALKLVEKWCGYSAAEWFTTHGKHPVTPTPCYSQHGALEFMDVRSVNGVEAYTPLERPLVRDTDWWLFYRPLNQFIPVEIIVKPFPCGKAGVISHIALGYKGGTPDFCEIVPMGFYSPLHIGTPFAEGDWFGDWIKTAFQCEPSYHDVFSQAPQERQFLRSRQVITIGRENIFPLSERQLPLVEWITDAVRAAQKTLKRSAKQHGFSFLSLPIAGLTVRLPNRGIVDPQIDSIKAARRAEYSYVTSSTRFSPATKSASLRASPPQRCSSTKARRRWASS